MSRRRRCRSARPGTVATVGGIISVTAAAADNIGVQGVQFKVDGANLGAEDTSPPFAVPWDTRVLANGAYTLTATARDAAGNTGASPPITVTVDNVPDTTPPARAAGSPAGTLPAGTSSTAISLTTNEAAACRYSPVAAVAWADMTATFTNTGGTAHSTQVSGLNGGTTYTFYVRCRDTSNNANLDDYPIAFAVAAAMSRRRRDRSPLPLTAERQRNCDARRRCRGQRRRRRRPVPDRWDQRRQYRIAPRAIHLCVEYDPGLERFARDHCRDP